MRKKKYCIDTISNEKKSVSLKGAYDHEDEESKAGFRGKEFKADREVKKEPAEEEKVFVCYQARILKSV